MLLWLYLRNGTGIPEDMAWSINAVCVGIGLWFSKERKGYRFKAWSSTIGNKDSEQKSYLLWIPFFFLPAFLDDFDSCVSGSMMMDQRISQTQRFFGETQQMTIVQRSPYNTPKRPSQSWPCTMGPDQHALEEQISQN